MKIGLDSIGKALRPREVCEVGVEINCNGDIDIGRGVYVEHHDGSWHQFVRLDDGTNGERLVELRVFSLSPDIRSGIVSANNGYKIDCYELKDCTDKRIKELAELARRAK